MYKIMGADQREYGPVDSQAVREWIAQGRANGQTLASFEGAPWKPLSSFSEFADALRTAVPPPLPPPAYGTVQLQQRNSAAVAGLTLSILGILCGCMPFAILGLGFSIVGFLQIKKNPATYTTGKAIPIAGMIIGIFGTVLLIWAMTTAPFQEKLEEIRRQLERTMQQP